MPAIDINRWMLPLLDQLQHSRQRQLVALQGPRSWCDDQFVNLHQLDSALHLFSNRELGKNAIPFSKAETCLGGESMLVVVDLFEGFNPDVLCIASGLVQAGGVLLLLSPAVEDWDLERDRYAIWQDQARSTRARFPEYFFAALTQDTEIGILLTPRSAEVAITELGSLEETPIEQDQTVEQAQACQAIEKWIDSKRQGVVLINADRGRGKSTCLGQLVDRLQTANRHRVLVSASSRQAAAQLLQWAPRAQFVAPDQLLQDCPAADLLVIDEAAMIPQSLLRQLTRCYPRMIMATTRGGYEGTGQGFMLRFVAGLERQQLQQLELKNPVRWCQGDQLETWIDQTLMLSSETTAAAVGKTNLPSCEFMLLEDPGEHLPLLRQVYALLSSAHYRTRPSDLRMLMESPDLVVIVARRAGQLVGAALLNAEGGFDDALCNAIFLGQRRPKGHLLAQMLTAQAGIKNFAGYRGLRIQRIAVAEAWRRQELGTGLLAQAMHYANENNFDYLGASFALDPDTARFWQRADFALVHVSYAQGKSSGSHSIAVLKPVRPLIADDIATLQQRLQQQLATWMTQFLQFMDASHVTALLRYAGYQAEISELEQSEIAAFAGGSKGFELCFASLQKFVMQSIAQSVTEPNTLLIEKAVQNRDWGKLERESGSEGRKQLQQRLRALVEALIKAC